MVPLLRAEFRKVFSIRSTYVLSALGLLLAGFLAFWVYGYRSTATSPEMLMEAVVGAATAISVFVAIVSILLVTHEYRYNTIMYTLTSSNSRSKVLFAKLAVIAMYALAFTVLVMVITALLTLIGAHMQHESIPPQQFYYWDALWRVGFFVLGYALIGMIFALLFRHVVGAIVTFLILPSTIEGLLSLLLKENTKYLPFSALNQVQSGVSIGGLAPGRAALIVVGYIIIGWLVAWWLFVRRDAN